jgi:glycosyltransferase involved in cell wall biosynthesis
VKVYCHEDNQNRGVAASLNLGLRHADADLIAFIDHDDVWYADKVERQVAVFEERTDIGLVYTNGHVIDDRGKKLYKIFRPTHREQNDPVRLLLDCYIKSCSMVMVRKKILEKAGMFNERLLTTDHDMWLRIHEVSIVSYISDCLMGYRIHPAQSILKRKLWEDGFIILKDACNRYPYGSGVRRKRRAVLHFRLGEHDLKMKKFLKGGWHLLLSFVYDPVRALKFLAGKHAHNND